MEAVKPVNARYQNLKSYLLLAAFCGASMPVYSSPDTGCNGVSRLHSLDVSVESLALQPVEHLPARMESSPILLDSTDSLSKAVVPILQLAPHIAAILNSVFETSEIESSPQNEVNAPRLPAAGSASQLQKIEQEVEDSAVPVNSLIPGDDFARFQRQMYRKDI